MQFIEKKGGIMFRRTFYTYSPNAWTAACCLCAFLAVKNVNVLPSAAKAGDNVPYMTICHVPAGHLQNSRTMNLPEPAAMAHLAHHGSDYPGPCRDVIGDECVSHGDCDDGKYCTGPERCEEGYCVPGPLPCGDGEVC
jgi:hypothetical protein